MNILAIESASTVCGATLFLDDKMMETDEITKPRIHGERLPVIINNLLSKYKVEISDLDGIAVSEGPGSYTGLRIGMCLAKGMAVTAEIPIIPVPTLEVINRGISRKGLYWVLLHSHKDVVFVQRFNSGRPDSQIECKVYTAEHYIFPVGFNLDAVCKSEEYESAPPSSKYVGELALRFFHQWAESNLNRITPNYLTNINIGNISTH